jgi:hypothetical protein
VRNDAHIHTLERSNHPCPSDIPPTCRCAVSAAIDITTCPAKTPVTGIPAVAVVTATETRSASARAAFDRRLDGARSAPRS